MKLRAYAKINLTLDVTGRREDGYHTLDTVMQTVSVWDEVEIKKINKPGIRLFCNREYLPVDTKNTAFRAAQYFFERCGITGQGLSIHIRKYIPSRAGMGGGSADGDQTGPHPGCTVCAVSGSRLCVFLWNGDYHTGISEEDAGKDVQSHAGFADQVF